MNFKRIFRGPYLYVLIALVGIFIGWSVIAQSGTQQIDTQKGLEQLADGKVSSVVVNSTEQRVDLTLKDGNAKEQFYYPRRAVKRSSRPSTTRTCPTGTTTPCSRATGSCRCSASSCRS